MKLTKPQVDALRDIVGSAEGRRYAAGYKPVQQLFSLGFVSVVPLKWGNHRYTATDLGRAALTAKEPKP